MGTNVAEASAFAGPMIEPEPVPVGEVDATEVEVGIPMKRQIVLVKRVSNNSTY